MMKQGDRFAARLFQARRLALILMLLLLAPFFCRDLAATEVDWRTELLEEVNATRAAKNLPPLRWSDRLAEAAAAHAADLQRCDKVSHNGCDGSNLRQRMQRTGYAFRAAAENIALCVCDPGDVVRLWMTSEGHRRNLLLPDVTEIGSGRRVDTEDPRRFLWVLVLGRE